MGLSCYRWHGYSVYRHDRAKSPHRCGFLNSTSLSSETHRRVLNTSIPATSGRGSRLGVSRWHPPYQLPSISVPAVRNGSVRTVTEASSPRDLLPGGPPLSDHHLMHRSGTRRPARTLGPRRWRPCPSPVLLRPTKYKVARVAGRTRCGQWGTERTPTRAGHFQSLGSEHGLAH